MSRRNASSSPEGGAGAAGERTLGHDRILVWPDPLRSSQIVINPRERNRRLLPDLGGVLST